MRPPELQLKQLYERVINKDRVKELDFLRDSLYLTNSYPNYLLPMLYFSTPFLLLLLVFGQFWLFAISFFIFAVVGAYGILVYFKELLRFYKKWREF